MPEKLQEAAQRIAESLLSGNLDQADFWLRGLQQQISKCGPEEDLRAAAAIVLHAGKLARVHRAQTLHSLQSLARESLYEVGSPFDNATFQMDG